MTSTDQIEAISHLSLALQHHVNVAAVFCVHCYGDVGRSDVLQAKILPVDVLKERMCHDCFCIPLAAQALARISFQELAEK
jgi:hypothetical protein